MFQWFSSLIERHFSFALKIRFIKYFIFKHNFYNCCVTKKNLYAIRYSVVILRDTVIAQHTSNFSTFIQNCFKISFTCFDTSNCSCCSTHFLMPVNMNAFCWIIINWNWLLQTYWIGIHFPVMFFYNIEWTITYSVVRFTTIQL